jgi:CheY-like chemotaxis protein
MTNLMSTRACTTKYPDIRGRMALVADASPHTAELFARSLRHVGVGVLVAHTCPRTLDHLKICRFDLVIVDLELPLGGGLRALETLHADPRHARARSIMVASTCDPADRWMAILAGASTVLLKPVRAAHLLETAVALLPCRSSIGMAV